MNRIIIAPLAATAINQLIDVAHRAWHAHYPGIITVEQIDYMLQIGYNPAVITQEMERQGIAWFSIMDGTSMIGFMAVGPYETDIVKLHKLYLLPEYHGKGIGSLALARVEQVARDMNARRIVLNVNKQNHRAIRAYERAGWLVIDEVVNDIGNGFVMDDFVMSKQIYDQS
ncbi:MAG: GNAT family N-acetyltransferase [Desulfuromonadales bacterium]|nr:GNAT family N-acetyltransferase [Desulfuromonadales bacterium]